MLILRQSLYTKYDETDNIKRMNDADILAEKKKKGPGVGSVLNTAAGGTLAGATVGGLALGGAKVASTINNPAFKGLATGAKFKAATGGLGKTLVKGGKWGALAGGALAAAGALHKRSKKAEETEFYNRRLEYAQRQARRREKKDWKANMTTGREGYSY